MAWGGVLQETRDYTFSCPRFFAEISDQAAVATNLAQIVAGASINLIAFREVAKLPSVRAEQAIGASITDIPAAPTPKTFGVNQVPSSQGAYCRPILAIRNSTETSRELLFL